MIKTIFRSTRQEVFYPAHGGIPKRAAGAYAKMSYVLETLQQEKTRNCADLFAYGALTRSLDKKVLYGLKRIIFRQLPV